MKIKRLFPHDDIGYEDFLKTVKFLMEGKIIFCMPDTIEVGVSSLVKLNNEEQQRRLISSSILIDKTVDERNQSLKIPTILTLANFMANYYERVKMLNDDELVTLGLFYSASISSSIDESFDLISCKKILSSVVSKTVIYDEQMEILTLIEDNYSDFLDNNGNKDGLEKFKDDAIKLIKNSSKDELLSMVKSMQEREKELYEQNI